ncbi:MAG: sulfite exporter TauE/SafE family protein [Clostridia bacterium]|nr:sulfite exporter TauE/SafE family protein [Clostridia bacterium]
MPEYLRMLLLICPLIFCAGFIDAIAGGGGLIALPAYLFAGLPSHDAIGTNKLAGGSGLIASSIKYIKEGKVRFSVAVWSALGCIGGAAVGGWLALLMPERILKMLMLAAVPAVAVFLAVRKDQSTEKEEKLLSRKKEAAIALCIGFGVGIYDGMIGPGTGTFLILAFTAFLGLELVTASGCAKVSNLASNLTSVVIYACSGNIRYAIAIPAALCSVTGSWLGAKVAVKGGGKRVRQFMYVVLVLLFAKMIYDLIV